MRRLMVTWISLMAFTTQCLALGPQDKVGMDQFLRHSGVTEKSVAWSKIIHETQSEMPLDLQREFQLFLSAYPDARLPKMSVTRLDESSDFARVRFDYSIEGQKYEIEFTGKKELALLRSKENGKTIEKKISFEDLRDPVHFMSRLSGVSPLTDRIPSVQVLSASEVKKLGEKSRRDYVDQMREVLAAAEKAQVALQKKENQALLFRENFRALFVDSAFAGQPEGECVVAGWMGQYQNGSCSAPPEARSGECTRCNTDIYGANSPCAGPASGKLPINATEICNQKTEENKYKIFSGVKSEGDVAKKKKSVSAVLTGLREKCDGIKAGVVGGKALSDQVDACQNLSVRILELEATQCQILASSQTNFPDLKCRKPKPNSPPVEVAPPIADAPPAAQDQAIPGAAQQGSAQGDCLNLPIEVQGLQCPTSQVRSLACDDGGVQVRKYFCVCNDSQNEIRSNSSLPTGCEAKSSSSSRSDSRPKPSRVKVQKDEPFFKPWMGAALGMGLILYYQYYMQKQALKSAYSIYNSATPVATPVPSPVTTVVPTTTTTTLTSPSSR